MTTLASKLSFNSTVYLVNRVRHTVPACTLIITAQQELMEEGGAENLFESGQIITFSGFKFRFASNTLFISNNGAYLTCQTWNKTMREGEVISAETNRLNVLYAPRVKVVPTVPELNIEEGELAELKCTADANPPATNFAWTHLPLGETHADREWRVHVRRAHADEFRCTAVNSLDSASDRIRLNVLYGPTVRIRTVAGGGSVVSPAEGARLVVDCEADANPKADAIAWSGPGGFQRNGSRLVIGAVNRAHSGNFTCTAWNTLSLSSVSASLSKSPSLSVASPNSAVVIRTGSARVLVDVRRRPGPATISAKQTTLNVGETITLSCGTDGDAGSPPAQLRAGVQLRIESFGHWTVTERMADASPDCPSDESCVRSLLSILRFAHPISWADKGNYSCLAHNSATSPPVSSQSLLSVIHQSEDGIWRSLDCFPLAESDGILHGILAAEQFKVRYCSHEHSNWLSKLFFCWTNPLLRKGFQGHLSQVDDVFHLPPSLHLPWLQRDILGESHGQSDHADQRLLSTEFSFAEALFRAYGRPFLLIGVVRFTGEAFRFASPILLHLLITSLQESSQSVNLGYCAALMSVSLFVSSVCDFQFNLPNGSEFAFPAADWSFPLFSRPIQKMVTSTNAQQETNFYLFVYIGIAALNIDGEVFDEGFAFVSQDV